MIRFKRTKCNCKECPLEGRAKVQGLVDLDKFKTVLIGEAPGEQEELKGEPFAGASGSALKKAVANSGLLWHAIYKMNVLSCRPANNDITTGDAQAAIKCCRPGFDEEIEWLKGKGVRVVVPLGNTAMEALGIKGKIGKLRGSVFPDKEKGWVVIPTYHPAYILRGMWKEEPTWYADFVKVRDTGMKEYKPPKERFNLFPTLADLTKFAEDQKGKLLGVDIETTGLNEQYAKIIMIGFASSGEDAMVVPFFKQGGIPYWKPTDEVKVRKVVQKIFLNSKLMFQNASFDVLHLMQAGFEIQEIEEDTMLLHHRISPELPHNLGYIVSVYGKTPYWKDTVLGSEDRMINMDDKEVRTYNARDSVVLHQVLPNEMVHAKEVGAVRNYKEVAVKLVVPLVRMTKNGLPIDQGRLASKKKEFTNAAKKAQDKCRKIAGLPVEFNMDSPDQIRYLFWGEKPKSYKKAVDEIAAYDVKVEGKKPRNKNTKAYRELQDKVELYDRISPLRRVMAYPPKTESGAYSTDGEALTSITRAAHNRAEAIKGIQRKTPNHAVEEKELATLIEFITEFRKFSDADKLASTFAGFPLGKDGRVHPKYKIHGTTTGRLSSSEPNGQNIPEEVQGVFKAGKGYVIIKADYSNIEYRVMALVTGEDWLIEEFDKGVNFHDINTKLLFGIGKEDPQWSTKRRVAKVFAFGLFYGSTIDGMYSNITAQIPEFSLTLAQFKALVGNYMEKMPKYAAWAKKQRETAAKTRCVETVFGFKRFLLGMPGEIERQGLNTPIQGSAGQVAEEAIIELDPLLLNKKEWDAKMILTVHDSILVECKEEAKMEVAREMKRVMEKEYTINGYKTKFPVDVEIGPSWGETEKVEVVCQTPKKSTTKKTLRTKSS